MPEFVPSLSSLITLSNLPDELGFIKTGLTSTIFNRIYYKDFTFSRSADGTEGQYQLTLVVGDSVQYTIPGTGIIFKLNSDYPTTGSLIPVTLSYRLGILKYIKDFNVQSFYGTAQELYNLIFELVEITDEMLIQKLADKFFPSDDGDSLDLLAADLTSRSIVSVTASAPVSVSDIISAFNTASKPVRDEILTRYVKLSADLSAQVEAFNELFSDYFNRKPEDVIKELFIPEIYAAVNVEPSIQFPTNILKAINAAGAVIQYTPPNASLQDLPVEIAFNLGDLSYSTTGGFGFPDQTVITVKQPQQADATTTITKIGIMNTGLKMWFTQAKLDLSKKTTIAEAAALGYGPTFRGIVINSVTLYLPDSWTTASAPATTPAISQPAQPWTIGGTDIVVGAEEGGSMEFSGQLSLSQGAGTWFEFFNGNVLVRLDAFSISFVRNDITGSNVQGKVRVLGAKDKANPANDIELDVDVIFSKDGFEISFSSQAGVDVLIPNVAELKFKKLRLGRLNDKWFIEISVFIDLLFSFPFADKFLPDYINLYPLLIKQNEAPDFNVEISWTGGGEALISSDGGFTFEKTKVINKTIADILKIELLKYSIKGENDGKLNARVLGSGSFKLGPASGSIKDTGIQVTLKFPNDNSGNLGPVDAKLSFVPPNGIGISLDNNVISGGGFASYDNVQKSFKGIINLKLKDIAITGIAILDTKLPDGSKGISLIVLLFTEFPDIPLGFGFNLQGVGGLLGFNRTVMTQKIRDGLSGTQLDDVLFPDNPIAKAATIINEVETIFPSRKGTYVIGPMAKISWGSPAIITGKLGLLVEFPNPFTIIILGNIKAILPDPQTPTIRLKINFLGVIDFDQKLFSFDAYLYDSDITGYVLTGGMALRVKWGDQPNFVLTLGGFHPAYTPPPLNIPDLPRLAISMSVPNVDVRAEAYLAITSNSFQIGARVEAHAKIWKITGDGYMFCDTLIQFSPFRFVLTAGMGITVKFNGKTILSIQLDFMLEGPGPWHALGSAEIKILRISYTLNFELTIGNAIYNEPVTKDILPDLLAALQNRNNWEALLPQRNQTMVSLREIQNTAGDLILHAFGGLKFMQNVVPLDRNIGKYGNASPKDFIYFHLTNPIIGTLPALTPEYTMGSFAAGDFEFLSEHEKLTRPAYEPFKNGLRFNVGSSGVTSSYYVRKEISYETNYVDVRLRRSPKPPVMISVSSSHLNVHLQDSAVTQSSLSFKSTGILPSAPGARTVNEDKFVVSEKTSTGKVDNLVFDSYYEANRYMHTKELADPAKEGAYKVIPEFELA